MLKITKLLNELIEAKKNSKLVEVNANALVAKFMESKEYIELNKSAEDARVLYESKRNLMLKEMIKQKQKSIQAEDGSFVKRNTNQKLEISDIETALKEIEKIDKSALSVKIKINNALDILKSGISIKGIKIEEFETLSLTIKNNG